MCSLEILAALAREGPRKVVFERTLDTDVLLVLLVALAQDQKAPRKKGDQLCQRVYAVSLGNVVGLSICHHDWDRESDSFHREGYCADDWAVNVALIDKEP